MNIIIGVCFLVIIVWEAVSAGGWKNLNILNS